MSTVDDVEAKYQAAIAQYNSSKDLSFIPQDRRGAFLAYHQAKFGLPSHVPGFIVVEDRRTKKLSLYFSSKAADALGEAKQINCEVISLTERDYGDSVKVTCHVRLRMGERSFDSIGSCCTPKLRTYKGETSPNSDELTNCDMKAFTKAWRRGVMTVCGTGLSVEDEIHSIPDVHVVGQG